MTHPHLAVPRHLLILAPLFLLYIAVILLGASSQLEGDEPDYLSLAQNLVHGHFSSTEDVDLWWGPGYPIALMPFVALHLPLIVPRLANAAFLFGAVLYFYSTVRLYANQWIALLSAFLLGLYPPMMTLLPALMTESFSILLVCAFMFYFCRLVRSDSVRSTDIILSAFIVAWLALTKIFFGYVITLQALLFGGLFIWKRSPRLKATFLVYGLSLLLCLPYLLYTYSLTGKLFYWGSSGGIALYWMSSPYDDEYGDMRMPEAVFTSDRFTSNHGEFMKNLRGMSQIERDDEFKRQAVVNIAEYPNKFWLNIIANVGRMVYSFPFSNSRQKLSDLTSMLPNMVLVVLAMLCIVPTYLGRRLVPAEIFTLLAFCASAFAGLSPLSAFHRYFWPLVPPLGLWIVLTLTKVLRIEIRTAVAEPDSQYQMRSPARAS